MDDTALGPPAASPSTRILARGEGWQMGEIVCRSGPEDRPFEERHEDVSIAAVVEGSFRYRSAAGTALLYPGAFLLGNAGTCFECGHEHATGDRCIAFQYAPALFEEIAASAAGSYRYRFGSAMLPPIPALALPAVEAEANARHAHRDAIEDLAIRLAEAVLAATARVAPAGRAPSPRDQRRISAVLRHIEAEAEAPLDLDALAGIACMSKYHFLRTFRRIAGVTPYNFLIGIRMRRAALRIRTTLAPVSAIAYESGFGDLSTFNGRFRDMFGLTPGGLRKQRPAS